MLFTTAPLSGQFFPLVPLAWACCALGHEVFVATNEDFLPVVRRSGLPAIASGPAGDFIGKARAAVGAGPVDRRSAHGRVLAAIAAANLPGMVDLVETWRPDVVVSERAEFAAPVAAAAAGIPRVELRWGVAPLEEFRLAAETELAGPLAGVGLRRLPRPDLTLSPWPRRLRLPYATADADIRHVPYNGDAPVPRWLLVPHNGIRLCVTLGTVLPFLGADRAWDVVLDAVELLDSADLQCVLAVDEDVLAGRSRLPAAVSHAGRIPLSHLLARCDAVLHHGGHGTCLTALRAGCPQLVIPHFDDQFDNAEAVARSGAGLRLPAEQLTAESVAKAVLNLIGSVAARQAARAVAAQIDEQPSPAAVVGVLERLAG